MREIEAREIAAWADSACSPDALEHFRRYLFTLKHLRDGGIVRDRHLLCSTVLGPVENPVRSSAPDFVLPGGLEIYAYRPVRVSAQRPTMVIQTEGINALVDPGLIASFSQRFPVGRSWIHAHGASETFELFGFFEGRMHASYQPIVVVPEGRLQGFGAARSLARCA